MTLIKERPPAISWRDRLEPITETPNEWMRVEEYALPATAYSIVSALRRGDKKVPEGVWDFRAAKIGRRGVVFARFVTAKNEATTEIAA